jgi:hypothetical protein
MSIQTGLLRIIVLYLIVTSNAFAQPGGSTSAGESASGTAEPKTVPLDVRRPRVQTSVPSTVRPVRNAQGLSICNENPQLPQCQLIRSRRVNVPPPRVIVNVPRPRVNREP